MASFWFVERLFAVGVALAANAADSLDGEATQGYRFSLAINAHPSEILPTLLNKKLWLDDYTSLAHWLTLKLSSRAQKGLALYEIEPTPKGVQLALLLALTNQRPDMTMRRSDVAKRLRYESTLQQLKIEHRT
ncbi:MAG: hypothetical protein ACI91G_001643 [Gammaproteobacteria bacterium]